jgi:uncharacterized membrane protein
LTRSFSRPAVDRLDLTIAAGCAASTPRGFSIGGAGTLDGIFLTGVIAVLLARLVAD